MNLRSIYKILCYFGQTNSLFGIFIISEMVDYFNEIVEVVVNFGVSISLNKLYDMLVGDFGDIELRQLQPMFEWNIN
jgi:hypothetical protein